MKCPYCEVKIIKAYVRGKIEVCEFYPSRIIRYMDKEFPSHDELRIHDCDPTDLGIIFKRRKKK